MCKQALLDALHDMQLWGIVGRSRDPSLGKGRCGSNDEFLEAYRALEGKVRRLISENEKLRKYAHSLEVANIDMASRLEDYIGQYDPTDAFVIEVKAKNAKLCELVTAQKLLVDAVHAYWAGGMNQEQFNVLMKITARVDRLCDEIGIGVDT